MATTRDVQQSGGVLQTGGRLLHNGGRRGAIPQRVHLVGVGGAGLSGAARILHAQGYRVSGHDRSRSPFALAVRGAGVPVSLGEGERGALADDVELVVRSAAVPEDDPDCAAARERGVEVWKYAELLGRLAPARRTLGVAGTHGKTTTSWLLHHALCAVADAAGEGTARPGALIGGLSRELRTNAVPPGPDGWFAVEACEYDRSFLHLRPAGAAITNVEADHLDYYGSLAAIEEAFARYAALVPPSGLVVAGPEVPERVLGAARGTVWRLGHELDVLLIGTRRGHFRFRLRGPGWATPEVTLAIPGRFNVDNAALAIALAVGLAGREARLEPAEAAAAAARGVEAFQGAARRFERWGAAGGVEVVHDYAHHPSEVSVTLEAARRAFPGLPLVVLFQPHQHSRTARFLAEFVESLRGVDVAVVADVYGARAHIDSRAAGAEELALGLRRAGVEAVAPGDLSRSVDAVLARLPDEAALFVLGAGDVETIRDELFEKLALRRAGGR
jgi:UDP-N-acetylmuramate--alanine ligase